MDGPSFGGMNRLGGGMYKCLLYIPVTIFSKLLETIGNLKEKFLKKLLAESELGICLSNMKVMC